MSAVRKYAYTSEAEIRRMVAAGLNFPQIAEKLNVHLNSLRIAASLLGIKSGRGQETTMPATEWVQRIAAGETLRAIGAGHGRGVGPNAIHNALTRRALPTTQAACIAWCKTNAISSTSQPAARSRA